MGAHAAVVERREAGWAGDDEALVALMGDLADGVDEAVWAFRARYLGDLERSVRFHLGELSLRCDESLVPSLVTEAVLVIAHAAGGWRPDGGAAPWTWARLAIRAALQRELGGPAMAGAEDAERAFAGTTDEADLVEAALERRMLDALDDPGQVALLVQLAPRSDRLALVAELLGGALSDRNAEVLLAVAVQTSAGDPSPAVTVADDLGLSHDNVRQVVRRSKVRLREAIAADPRYADLAGITLVC